MLELTVAGVVGVGIFIFGVLFGKANPKKTQLAIDEYKKIEQKIEDTYKKVLEEIRAKVK